eukprot:1195888-Prorocentrum_minimum.AAC.2
MDSPTVQRFCNGCPHGMGWDGMGMGDSSAHPTSRGAFMSAHSEKCALYSSWLISPLPTSSMSGSFLGSFQHHESIIKSGHVTGGSMGNIGSNARGRREIERHRET